uniref:Mce/MlaD domain-containing protein n=1 Tax=Taenioma perpusillum TaxID=210852 RepID=A0A1Z1MRF7_9FLOR|nr:hypothetical protein [Taenioma perpusillum]ARW68459.1 hypothetical protein [Taenioma perpusillum]
MFNFILKTLSKYIGTFINIFMLCSIIFVLLSQYSIKKKSGYLLFIEFNNAYGIKEGTNIYFRGVQIGFVKNIYMKINSLIITVYIKSSKILIPKNSLVETNQTGLFNDTLIDIIPLDNYYSKYNNTNSSVDVYSKYCLKSVFFCNYHYIKGYRGLNYDDLIRAATRISQRFDDPRFFTLFYIFLQNNIDISNNILMVIQKVSPIFDVLMLFSKFIYKNIFYDN